MLRVLRLYLKVAIFQPELREHAPHTTSVLKSYDFPAGAAGARSAYYVCTSKLRFSSRSCRGPGGNRTRDRGIAKAGARTTRQLPKAVSRARKLHGATARALRHARSPQRVHRAQDRCARRHSESDPTRTIPAEGRARAAEIVKRPQFLNLDHANLRRGSRAASRNRKKPQFLNFDHANLRRGSRVHRRNRKKPSVFEPRPRESPQRVARGQKS